MSKIKKLILAISAFLVMFGLSPLAALAADSGNCDATSTAKECCLKTFGNLNPDQLKQCEACNQPGTNYDANTQSCLSSLSNNGIVKDLNVIVNILAGIAVLSVVGVIISGGIQYSLAGNPQAAAAARKRITNALIALFGFLFIYAFLQWLLPGGL